MAFKVVRDGRGNILDGKDCEIRIVSAGDRGLLLGQGWKTIEDYRNARKTHESGQAAASDTGPQKRKRRKPHEIAQVHEQAEAAGVLTDGRRIDAIERELEALAVG